ncbi:hypothetical protein [Lysinibacillus halotolerans]|uniref:Uncharacterized protein n=1 Tax=Lysinibacillus halotolerans TaxID=1368476 RepID=A0A3M8H0X3_9BACI|nr:hypothetical protein [Lysinibacillus halotolerans]RNC96143.1 hypothetical protein EC501_17745 [Lysinibacillus halotolerans]
MGIFKYIVKNPEEKYDIKFEIEPGVDLDNDMTDIQKSLFSDIENTNNIIKSLSHTNEEIKEKYFNKLYSLASAGFISDNPALAQEALKSLKDEMLLIEGYRIKNKYMLNLGMSVIISVILCWVIFGILGSLFDPSEILIYFVVWTGAMFGTWISFGARKFVIQLEDLSVLEEDKMSIYIRLPYIGICALTFLLFLNSGIFNFQIGGISLNDIKTNIEFQLVLGIVAGLLESKLGVKIFEKAQNMTVNT